MPPTVATVLCWLGIAVFVYLDRDQKPRTSAAVWIPVIWISIGASRMLSQWFGGASAMDTPDQYVEGSPFDRLFLSGILVLALGVLLARGRRSGELLRNNSAMALFLLYTLLSCVWSDFPLVTLKRWTKLLGNVAMVAIVLTDVYPMEAVKRLLARVSFLLIPTSILLTKYYPQLGRGYDRWVGTAMYTGVTDNKNSLGCLCLVCGLGTLWMLLDDYRAKPRRFAPLFVHGTILVMVLYLFYLANSATSLACFLLGSGVMVFLSRSERGSAATLHLMVGSALTFVLLAYLSLSAQTQVLGALGRDATLTGRTELWETLHKMNTSPWFGTGFESFFLGDRAEYLWRKYWWHPNEAHNGYFEVYLTLGRVGAALLAIVVVAGYRNVVRSYRISASSGTLRMAILSAAVFYNLTEAGIKVMHPVWIALLLAVVAPIPVPDEGEVAVEAAHPVPRSFREKRFAGTGALPSRPSRPSSPPSWRPAPRM